MCELLGLSFNEPVSPQVSFRAFTRRSQVNPDGWGIAFYPDKAAQVIKEPKKAEESKWAAFIKEDKLPIQSKIFIIHVRKTSVGGNVFKNTHPFHREFNGREYVFAHNGTLKNFKELKLNCFKPIGETDSEHVFCYLLGLMAQEGINQLQKSHFPWLHKQLSNINSQGKFNCLFSDGTYLFCYHDRDKYNGLCYLRREPPYEKIMLVDEDYEIDLQQKKSPTQRGYIIASRPLTDERWQRFKGGQLLVFKNGEMVFP
jgi:glutamine amidotransferase